jgi:hypothetical protein
MLINNGELDINPSNALILSYPNDILDGVYVDFGDNYSFISAHTPGYAELLNALDDECVGYVNYEDPEASEEPHCYVIKAVGQLMVKSLEDMLSE